jgi:hypothetical protein
MFKRCFVAFFALLIAALAVLPPMAAYAAMPTPSAGDVYDGVNFSAVFASGNGLYYGAYKHATNQPADYKSSQTPGWNLNPDGDNTDRSTSPASVLWRVMGEEASDGHITLLSEYVLDNKVFNDSYWGPTAFNYSGSAIQSWLNNDAANGFLHSSNFNGSETGGMATSDVVTGMYDYSSGSEETGDFNPQNGFKPDGTDYSDASQATGPWPTTASSQKVYLPWGKYYGNSVYWGAGNGAANMLGSGYTDNVAKLKDGSTVVYYWLRSPSSFYSLSALYVGGDGTVDNVLVRNALGVRPAFKLNPSSVIFTSEISSTNTADKTTSDTNYVAGSGVSNYKLTIKNTSLTAGSMTAGGQAADALSSGISPTTTTDAAPGASVSVAATGATAGTKLTYKIVDSTRTIVGYGQGANGAAVQVNAIGLDGSTHLSADDYTVYVWAQKDNTINSHEGSTPMYFTMTVVASDPKPEAPGNVTATAGNGQATVSFTPPTNANGYNGTITDYEVTINPGGATFTGTASPITVTGLTNGTAYTFTVTATDGTNTSEPSAPSNSVTPTSGGGTLPPGGGGGGGTNPPTAPDTSASSTTISNGGVTLAGVSYPIEKQSDGSWLVVVPYGTDITSLAITFALPTGAKSVPASGSDQDFSGGPITYTVTSANGTKTEQYVIRVNAAPATVTPGDIVDATGGGSAWTLNAIRNANGSYGVALIAPTSDLTSATRLPDGVSVVIGNAASWSGVSLALLDSEGNVIAEYDTPRSAAGARESRTDCG